MAEEVVAVPKTDDLPLKEPTRRGPSRKRSELITSFGERHPKCLKMVQSQAFETIIGAVICLNCATMGIQAEIGIGRALDMRDLTNTCEIIFVTIFMLELLARIALFGPGRLFPPCPDPRACGYYRETLAGSEFHWAEAFDAAIVLLSLVAWIMTVTLGDQNPLLRVMSVLRALRLLRIVRVVRKVEAFHEVYLLIKGLSDSGRVLLWTTVVIFIITYIFAIFGVVIISPEVQKAYVIRDPDSDEGQTLEMLWSATGGISSMMYTLIQVLTLDSWTSIGRPLSDYSAFSSVYFYLYILIAVFVLMNLVTAIIVENALTNSSQDEQMKLAEKERARQNMLEQFRALFSAMDEDGNEVLTKAEFDNAFETEQVSTKLRLLDFAKEDCRELFSLLDSGDGALSLEEFYEGLTRMEGQATAKDIFRILKNVEQVDRIMKQHAKESEEDLDQLYSLCSGGAPRRRLGSIRSRANEAFRGVSNFGAEPTLKLARSNAVSELPGCAAWEIEAGYDAAAPLPPSNFRAIGAPVGAPRPPSKSDADLLQVMGDLAQKIDAWSEAAIGDLTSPRADFRRPKTSLKLSAVSLRPSGAIFLRKLAAQ
eukprot:CAMPEP_0170570154 /NCGR_PEP_ID=MMETSP0224-20130122/951_1 /TAXON_ID=285029 /ORGANISM="Togula jolla, Strain CCCM 725" /LENGTH=594 /DNA_ID=CAMNT_0010892397 /DNA_START=61 /DNA_END=1846 /DNA_ORIENTATION=-